MSTTRLDLTPEEELARRTLDLFKRLTDMSDGAIGAALGVKHQAIHSRRIGHTRIQHHRDIPRLAEVFRIDPACFYMSDDELFIWIKEHRADLLTSSLPWIAMRRDLLRVLLAVA